MEEVYGRGRPRRMVPSVLLIFFVCAFLVTPIAGSTSPSDIEALQAFNEIVKASQLGVGIPTWFTGSGDPCDTPFKGITCDSSNPRRVTTLNLYSFGLSADSVAPLANLSAIRTIVLSANKISGEIPATFGQLQFLTSLTIKDNFLSGVLPDLSATPLRQIQLGGNRLKGSIPASFALMSQLKLLDLSRNIFQGPIPAALVANLKFLQTLNLNNNQLSGAIPYLGNLSSIITLNLHHNNFMPGGIPTEIGKLTTLTGELDLTAMNFIGPLIDLSELARVTDLIMDNNSLSGEFNPDLLPQGSLGFISAANNKFSGTINNRLLKTLEYPLISMRSCGVVLANNNFTGPLPTALGRLIQAFVLDFSGNHLTGPIPPRYTGLYQLARIYLQNNRLTGTIPPFFNDRISFVELDFSNNLLSGSIPPTMSYLSELRVFNVARNRLIGNFPPFFSSLTKVVATTLSNNYFTGPLPALLTAKSALLDNNYFAGSYAAVNFSPNATVSVKFNCLRKPGCVGATRNCFWTSTQRTLVACRTFCLAVDAPLLGPCSGRGRCYLLQGRPVCSCNPGFSPGKRFTCVRKRR